VVRSYGPIRVIRLMRVTRLRSWLGLLALLALVAAGSAGAAEQAEIEVSLSEDGGASLIANPNPPGMTWTWQACDREGEACEPLGAGSSIQPGSRPPGVTFRAASNTGLTALSPVWMGPLHVAAAPAAAAGPVRANLLVTPARGVWAGGWPEDSEATQLSACPTRAGTGCITLTPLDQEGGGCPGGGALISPDFTHWYLRVASRVYGPDTGFALPGRTYPYGPWPYGYGVWQAGPRTAVAVSARIEPATGPPMTSCGPATLVAGLPPQLAIGIRSARLAGDGTATVVCVTACAVELHASSRGRYATARADAHGELTMRIAPRRLARLGHGPVRFTLFLDAHRVAQRTVGR